MPSPTAFGSEEFRPDGYHSHYSRETNSMLEIDWGDVTGGSMRFRLFTDQQKPRDQHQSCTENRKPGGNYVSIIVHLVLAASIRTQDSRVPDSIENNLRSECSKYDAC